MLFVTRGLPVLVEIGLLVYCLIDCWRSPSGRVRGLPRWAWGTLILLAPLVGGIAWLVAGRPRANPRHDVRGLAAAAPSLAPTNSADPDTAPAPGARPLVAPDDNPEFIAHLQQLNEARHRSPTQGTNPRRPEQPPQDDDGPTPA